jgi:hypothetical protein
MQAKYTRPLVALVAGLALAVVAPAAASAAAWHVGGEELKAETALASTAETKEISMVWLSTETQCTGVQLQSASISPKVGGKIGKLVLTGCTLLGNTGCTISGGVIESAALKLEAALGGKSPEDTLALKPESGKGFLKFVLTGNSCAFEGSNTISGKATFTLPHGREELASQELSFNVGAGETSPEIKLTGHASVKLASGKAWSFR